MSDGDLGLTAAVSIALGGMIGGGIYAVLGVVAGITMGATWAAFVLAGAVALCAGYSYNALNELGDTRGGTISFVQSYLENSTVAEMVGWTLLVGYIESMAMYGFAFAEFAVALGLPDDIGDADADGAPERILLLVGGVTAAFVAVGSLSTITSFASLSFIVVFGGTCALAFGQRDTDEVWTLPPAVGTVGSAVFFPLMLWNLYTRELATFYAVLVVAVELLYFEREYIERVIEQFDPIESGHTQS